MPGIVGRIRGERDAGSIGNALAVLRHVPTLAAREIPIGPGIELGEVKREGEPGPESWSRDPESGVGVLVAGHVLQDGARPRRLGAEDIRRDLAREGEGVVSGYDGSFVLAILDERRRLLHLVNDRMGMFPCLYGSSGDAFAFAPEAKGVLAALGHEPQLDPLGLVNFLAAGYCFADATVFDGVRALLPGSWLTLDLDSRALSTRRHWHFRFTADPALDRRKASEEALDEAIEAAHRLVLCDTDRNFDILLSGGFDSRGMLGMLARLERLPRHAITFGLRDDIPDSDAAVARQLAAVHEVPFEFHSFDTIDFAANARRWCRVAELANDNIGWHSEGVGALSSTFDSTADFALLGDEVWGMLGWAFGEREAWDMILPPGLPTPLRGAIRSERRSSLGDGYERLLRMVSDQCENPAGVDLKDYVYAHIRVARFIGAVGYFKQNSLPMRRPFLANRVLDVVCRVPARFRVHKTAYLSMLSRYHPQLMELPGKSISSLPDWKHDMRTRPGVTEHFRRLLDPATVNEGPLGAILDPDDYRRIHDRFFAAPSRPDPRTSKDQHRLKRFVLGRFSSHRLYARGIHAYKTIRGMNAHTSMDDYHFLRRVALCSLMAENLDQLTRPDPAQSPSACSADGVPSRDPDKP